MDRLWLVLERNSKPGQDVMVKTRNGEGNQSNQDIKQISWLSVPVWRILPLPPPQPPVSSTGLSTESCALLEWQPRKPLALSPLSQHSTLHSGERKRKPVGRALRG